MRWSPAGANRVLQVRAADTNSRLSKPSLPSRLDPNLFPAPVKDKMVDVLEARATRAVAASHYTAKLARSAEIEGVLQSIRPPWRRLMPTLGDMLGAARRSAAGLQRWIETADPDLAEEVRMAAARAGNCPSGFARAAVADFQPLCR